MMIEDGRGTGRKAEVTSRFRLKADSMFSSKGHEIAHEDGDGYTWVLVPYNYAANDTIILVQNDSEVKDLIITDIYFATDTATDFHIHNTDETTFTPTGTAITGVNTNRKSSNIPPATAIGDETGNTRGNILLSGYTPANVMNHFVFDTIILGLDQSIAVDLVTVGTMAYATIVGHFQEAE